jgi:S-DNA-T family DNA segregation ATPase FtsK/SpoIIIE
MAEKQIHSETLQRSGIPTASDTSSSQVDLVVQVLSRFQRHAWDIAGILVLALAVMTLLALPGIPALSGGSMLNLLARVLRQWLGISSFLFVLAAGIAGLMMLRRRHYKALDLRWWRIFALELATFTGLILISLSSDSSLAQAEAGLGGGRVGWGLSEILRILFSSIGLTGIIWRYLFAGTIFFIALLYGLGLLQVMVALLGKLSGISTSEMGRGTQQEPTVSMAPLIERDEFAPIGQETRKKRTLLPAEFRKRLRTQPDDRTAAPPPARDERLPPLEMMVNEGSFRPDERNINLTAGLIEKTLSDFGIPAKVVGFRVGPTVTQFAVEPGYLDKVGGEEDAIRQKVRVSQISSLSRDLALALSAERLRIEAPVPGQPYVGIEVPNSRSSIVRLRPILESEIFYKTNSPLAIALGRDVSGQPVIADLERMPHLLIAGTTGSGKSVCIAALTACLVMNNAPEDLKLVMIDPKMVELVRFNGLPHLYGKVETDLQRILGVLHWLTIEMDHRYKLLEEMHARHIESYNRKMRRRKDGVTLPRIVVMIDELADLMMTAPEQTEPALVRLAQMARATGIHLVLATQRPSTDVVTGLIKANFPARISFAVASSIDSRVILDINGAESLLGHGDMLFMPPETSAPIRLQGVMVSDSEVEKVITFWQQAMTPSEEHMPPWEELLQQEAVMADKDDLLVKAINLVRETQRASASLLQRRLRIGYPRAARLIDELEEMGIIGPSVGGGREREVLVDDDEDDMDGKQKHLDIESDIE